MSYFAHFDLDLPEAIQGQLVATLGELRPVPLSRFDPKDRNGLNAPKARGVYVLDHNGAIAYVGASKNDLSRRIEQRYWKVAGRQNIRTGDVGVRCLVIHPNWLAFGPEDLLIRHYGPPWNGSGFGSNDPGRNRERTNKPPKGWDRRFPIRDDWACDIESDQYPLLNLLVALKDALPYVLRYGTADRNFRKGHPEFEGRHVDVPRRGMRPGDLLTLVVAQLPGWQATRFPSHLILYPETRSYRHGDVIARGP